MSKILTDAEAIDTVKRALSEYADKVGPTASAAEHEMSKISEEVDFFLEQCKSSISGLERGLSVLRAEEEPNFSLIAQKERELAVWLRKFDDTRRLQASLARDHDAFRQGQRRYTNAIAPLAQRGSERMRNAREDVIKYEKSQQVQARTSTKSWRPIGTGGGGSFGGGSSGGFSSGGSSFGSGGGGYSSGGGYSGGGGSDGGPSGGGGQPDAAAGVHDPGTGRFAVPGEVSVDGLPSGIVLAPLGKCVDEGRVNSAADFDFGRASSDDLTWAVKALYSDVLPRMARGGDIGQRLSDTDSGRGNSGSRSLRATYDGFFGSTAVKLAELPDGTYEVINGAHRIWVAQQLGVTHIPATIRRRGQ